MGERKRRSEYLKTQKIDEFIETLPEVFISRYRNKTVTGLEASKLMKGNFKNNAKYKIRIAEKVPLDHKLLFFRILYDNQKVSFEENCEKYRKMVDEYLSKRIDN